MIGKEDREVHLERDQERERARERERKRWILWIGIQERERDY